MEHSTQLNELAPALAKAQSEMGGAVKESANPFFKSKYADLTSVWKACKDALHSNGLSVIQSPVDSEGRIGVSTMLLHTSGQWVRDSFTLGVKKENDPQADGSSITYARRYALAAFVGVCPADDDAEGAMSRKSPNKAPKSANKPTSAKPRGKGSPPADTLSMKDIRKLAASKGLVEDDLQRFMDWYEKDMPMTQGMAKDLTKNWDMHFQAYLKVSIGGDPDDKDHNNPLLGLGPDEDLPWQEHE